MMGLEAFSIAVAENPDLIKAVSEKFGQLCVSIAENILQRDRVGAYWVGDDLAYTTGLMVSPDFLRRYVFPFYKRIGELCRQYNKPLLFHSDGNIVAVLDDLIECQVDAVHPNEPTSVNIVDLKAEYGSRLSFIGAMDVDLMARGTIDQVVAAAKSLIASVAPGGGFVLGAGNPVPKYIPLENYRALLNTAREFGSIY